ncbi:MAG: hypothetical protein KKD44_16120 [Proteobacteria bacterium]|nr:hypothetical protein [Pseudomonadota bacterium]
MKYEDSKIWLFSFADLAFLLLIAFTQASTVGKKPVNIGEITIPKVVENQKVASLDQPYESYQIRVLKPTIPESNPFQVVIMRGTEENIEPSPISAQELTNRLTVMKQDGRMRPILVPDIYSLSKDTLMAMSIIERVYEDGNRVTIERTGGLN